MLGPHKSPTCFLSVLNINQNALLKCFDNFIIALTARLMCFSAKVMKTFARLTKRQIILGCWFWHDVEFYSLRKPAIWICLASALPVCIQSQNTRGDELRARCQYVISDVWLHEHLPYFTPAIQPLFSPHNLSSSTAVSSHLSSCFYLYFTPGQFLDSQSFNSGTCPADENLANPFHYLQPKVLHSRNAILLTHI